MQVLLVYDHAFMRRALYMLLDERDIGIVGEGSNGREAVTLIRQSSPIWC